MEDMRDNVEKKGKKRRNSEFWRWLMERMKKNWNQERKKKKIDTKKESY